jgi:hypothetical protein
VSEMAQTYEEWNRKLKAGEYKEIGGARKGVGKCAWPQEVKDKAYKDADRYFAGQTSTSSAPPKKQKKVKHERAAALTGPRKGGPMAARQRKMAASKPRTRRPAVSSVAETLAQVQVANEKIKTVAAARDQLERGQVVNTSSMQMINDIVVGAVKDLHTYIFGASPDGGNGRPEPTTPPDVLARMRASAAASAAEFGRATT